MPPPFVNVIVSKLPADGELPTTAQEFRMEYLAIVFVTAEVPLSLD